MSNKESIELTAQEEQLIDHFANFFLEVIVSGELKFSDDTDDIQLTVTEEFITKLREILT